MSRQVVIPRCTASLLATAAVVFAVLASVAVEPASAKVLNGTAGADVLLGTPAADALHGRAGRDRLDGRAGADRIFGGRGADRLLGGRGKDRLSGGPGADHVRCGPGRDVVIADHKDVVAANCERVRRTKPPSGPQPGPGETQPTRPSGPSAELLGKRREQISGYLRGLGRLPVEAEVEPTPTGAADTADEILADAAAPAGRQRYTCTTTPYTITRNPDKIVTFNPDASKLWLGALLQGDGYAGGPGSLKLLPFDKRAPLTIYADLLGRDVARTVQHPNAATVQSAIGDLVKTVEDAKVAIPTVASFRQTSVSELEEGLLKLGFSARYLAGQASGKLETKHAANESTVMASLVQRYFTVSMVVPPTPADHLDLSQVTVEDVEEQARLGRLGPGNPPVVVSSISYGRTFLMTVTAKASSQELSAALSAAFEAVKGGGKLEVSAEHKKILSSARIEVVSNGGDEAAFRDAIKTQKFDPVLERPSQITAARPISYQVDNIGDNSAAKFSETDSYNLRECRAEPNRYVPAGEIVKLTNLRAYTEKCDYSVYGRLYVNGVEVFSRSRDDANDKIPAASWWTVPTSWPNFVPPDKERYRITETQFPPDGFYVARFTDPGNGPTEPQLRVTGNLNAWNWIWGDPANIFDRIHGVPFEYGDHSIAGGSAHCPMTLHYTLQRAAELNVAVP